MLTLLDVAELAVARGFSIRHQSDIVASLREAFSASAEGAPEDVKRQMLQRLHDQVMGENEPSAGLQYNLTARLSHSLHFLTDPTCKLVSENKSNIKSSLIMATAPGARDASSWTEYASVMRVDRGSVKAHVEQRDNGDADKPSYFKLIRAPKDNAMRLMYEKNACEYLHKVADPRNLGSQKNSKVPMRIHFCSLICHCRT